MKPVYVLWGTKEGAEEWQEDLICETEDPATLEKAKTWATHNGFVKLRVLV